MSAIEAYKASRIIETLENYAVSDNFADAQKNQTQGQYIDYHIYADEQFWCDILNNPKDAWNREYYFDKVGFSEWVARVPGLFYSKGSATLRRLAESKVEFVSKGKWKHYSPSGKSEKVMGGIGTISLPNEDGQILGSISTSINASVGIPVLFSEEVSDYHNLKEGSFLSGKGKWKKMSNDWATRFPSTSGIPKGYLEINNPDDIQVDIFNKNVPTIFHPFSIMEYEKDGALFYDYVYVTVDSTEENYRNKIAAFFGEYEYFDNRNGRYLIEPFINNPILNNVQFNSPKELRNISTEAKPHLELLVDRIRNESFKGETLNSIKIALDNYCTLDQLKRISDTIQINPNRWFTNRAIVHESAALLDYCHQRNKVEELVDALSLENPDIFITK